MDDAGDYSPQQCAEIVLETVPVVIRWIRNEMRQHRGADVSVPQLRTLVFVQRAPGSSLVELANHLGITPPSASKLVDGLVAQQLLSRRRSTGDRRRVCLQISQRGAMRLGSARQATLLRLSAKVVKMAAAESRALAQGLRALATALEIPPPLRRSGQEGKSQ